ncbi:Pyridine nucleotide-disulfide oxidoreductase domain-containing protein 2-like isoform X1 [Oopsacas minuta]|uniref:Pyridine nucleotide-disulfide oxidoreductase domain-containing protein 2 n=1 Tax=Oopsacas minuta TaxID=111878 RepID=A0AAV7JCY2_9METZ|nr:Pyridine nucleotide-disulfide oxidoreductase domain-containing protein 2-like isoform X1 [Oopsacas minuta]
MSLTNSLRSFLTTTRLAVSNTVRSYSSQSIISHKWDVTIIGAGHNGLVAAAYLARSGKKVLVLERRHLVGGAAVTEEIIPGFKFSRASYVLSLLRPRIIKELELVKFGLKVYQRNTHSFTPMRDGRYLILSSDVDETRREISKFSLRDADRYSTFEDKLCKYADAIQPYLERAPADFSRGISLKSLYELGPSLEAGRKLGLREIPEFTEFLISPASKWLRKWFESEPLLATLATDAVIGAMISPNSLGSSYVLLHHVMGEYEGRKNVWVYPEGGMGSVSRAIANSAVHHGARIEVDKTVTRILVHEGRAIGVELENGEEIRSEIVMSNATPYVTFSKLLERDLPKHLQNEVNLIDYTSPVTKINVAVKCLPNFTCLPNSHPDKPQSIHSASIHLNCESMTDIHKAYLEGQNKQVSTYPMIEMCIPSSLDPTLAPKGAHVISLFTQYTPYNPIDGPWTESKKEDYCNCVFNSIEDYAPGFKQSVVGKDILTPPDLEAVFGLTGGNIFHGALSLDQLYWCRPSRTLCGPVTPIANLFQCGSGIHPSGGVMGSPGLIAAETVIELFRNKDKNTSSSSSSIN